MPKSNRLLPVLMSWSPAAGAEEHRFPVGSVSSLAIWWTCLNIVELLHTCMRHPKPLLPCDLSNYNKSHMFSGLAKTKSCLTPWYC